jgi:5-methylcytosine-specific restriction endonuclease McrA
MTRRRHAGARRRQRRLSMLAVDPRCTYCGAELTERTSTLDHVTPRARGGSHARENCVLSCKRCNRMKGAWTAEQVLEWAQRVAAVANG